MIHPSIVPLLPKVVYLLVKHKVKDAYLFGSVLTNKFDLDSDVDFLINFEEGLNPILKGDLWWSLHDSLRDVLNREVDLISEKSLKNPYFIKDINRTKNKIYG
jgi:predicted nucleotidyltransferase